MIIYKGKMAIELDEDLDGIKEEIEQLEQLKDKIATSATYFLLDGKTQMIDKKEENEIRSRLDHTNNVAEISRRIIARIYDICSINKISGTEIFKLNKKRAELYTEITALAHDLGHTPFGHNAEAVLNEFMGEISDKDEIAKIIQNRIRYFGIDYEEAQGHTDEFTGRLSFEHNEQSALVFSKMIEDETEKFDRVDVKKIVLGILSHSISRVPEAPEDLIAQIVRQTDKIEYRNMDYEEIMSYIEFHEGEQELYEYQSLPVDMRIDMIVENIVNEAIEKGGVYDDNEAMSTIKKLRKKYENVVYLLGTDGKRGLLSGDNRERQQVLYKKLLQYYYENPDRIPTKSRVNNHPINDEKEGIYVLAFDKTKPQEETKLEMVVRYLNTFTNSKCERAYLRLVKERTTKGKGHGIEPITTEEIEERKKIQIREQIEKLRGKDLYKGIESHTDEEYYAILQSRNRKFIQNDITEKARETIKKNRDIHEKEYELDEELIKQMQSADERRKIAHENRTNGESPAGDEPNI